MAQVTVVVYISGCESIVKTEDAERGVRGRKARYERQCLCETFSLLPGSLTWWASQAPNASKGLRKPHSADAPALTYKSTP